MWLGDNEYDARLHHEPQGLSRNWLKLTVLTELVNSPIVGNPYLIALRQSCSSSRRNNLLTAAETDPACSILPRAPHGVTRDSCSVFLASGEQFPSNQPAHRSLRRTLRKSNRLGQLLITHLNGSLPTCLFGHKPYIDKEAGGSPVVADQVAHQHVYDVIIQVQHGYTGQ